MVWYHLQRVPLAKFCSGVVCSVRVPTVVLFAGQDYFGVDYLRPRLRSSC